MGCSWSVLWDTDGDDEEVPFVLKLTKWVSTRCWGVQFVSQDPWLLPLLCRTAWHYILLMPLQLQGADFPFTCLGQAICLSYPCLPPGQRVARPPPNTICSSGQAAGPA